MVVLVCRKYTIPAYNVCQAASATGRAISAMITVQEMVQRMRSADKPFDITFVTANRTTGEGGQVRELRSAELLTKKRASRRILDFRSVRGTRAPVRIHLDLILWFNNIPVA
ncbi:hypothetical protein BLX24_08105 [Arsenicibacter rosenii]|uniref:Uncharacterized protein n=2 Tax=Arsenicibacter rosenii TaxID=1750698 RepID=A0A1S2VM15_9BACT|nr:hypothetical protein BLX24_08105 [Arsenicibacter rosenii]